jgi:hypothetical protein
MGKNGPFGGLTRLVVLAVSVLFDQSRIANIRALHIKNFGPLISLALDGHNAALFHSHPLSFQEILRHSIIPGRTPVRGNYDSKFSHGLSDVTVLLPSARDHE